MPRMIRHAPSGVALGTFASGLNDPYGIAFDRQGNLYVADYGSGTIRKFSPSGSDLGVFASGLVGPRDLVIVEPVVSYACAGFEAPFAKSISLKRGVQRSTPLKMELVKDGTPITDLNIAGAAPVVHIAFSTDGATEVDVTDQLGSNVFAFNPTTGLWTFQLGTGPFTAAGTYRVSAQPGEASYTINPGCSGEFVRLQ
jgi:NHL repeat